MQTIITELVERFALGPDGVDLRAELDALQSARVSQALEQTGGDVARAAKLLRMTRLDLLRLEERLAAGRAPTRAGRPRFEPPPVDGLAASAIPRIVGGVELISAAAIRRLAVEGFTERQIAARMGCNPYAVEKVLREETARKVLALDAERIAPSDIASRLQLPLALVRRILAGPEHETRRRPKAGRACAARKRQSQ
jgi:hypothetical protein